MYLTGVLLKLQESHKQRGSSVCVRVRVCMCPNLNERCDNQKNYRESPLMLQMLRESHKQPDRQMCVCVCVKRERERER